MKRSGSLLGSAVAILAIGAILIIAASSAADAGKRKRAGYTADFPLDACAGLATSTAEGARNRYFPLQIFRVWELSNEACVDAGECDELEEVRITVLDETEIVDGVTTRVVEEREWVDGDLEEVSRNFYVECLGTEDVYYFGEDVVDGDGNPVPDGWRAGVNGARPGIIFPGGAVLLGARYFQEVAPGVALDRAEHRKMGLDRTVPAGSFSGCVLVLDTNALDDPKGKNGDEKVYCPGVGIIMDEEMELTSFSIP
jgi:hypothetical protein